MEGAKLIHKLTKKNLAGALLLCESLSNFKVAIVLNGISRKMDFIRKVRNELSSNEGVVYMNGGMIEFRNGSYIKVIADRGGVDCARGSRFNTILFDDRLDEEEFVIKYRNKVSQYISVDLSHEAYNDDCEQNNDLDDFLWSFKLTS